MFSIDSAWNVALGLIKPSEKYIDWKYLNVFYFYLYQDQKSIAILFRHENLQKYQKYYRISQYILFVFISKHFICILFVFIFAPKYVAIYFSEGLGLIIKLGVNCIHSYAIEHNKW